MKQYAFKVLGVASYIYLAAATLATSLLIGFYLAGFHINLEIIKYRTDTVQSEVSEN